MGVLLSHRIWEKAKNDAELEIKIKSPPKIGHIAVTSGASSTSQGLSSTLWRLHLPASQLEWSSRPAAAHDKHMGQSEVTAFPLRSSGVLGGHFLLHNNRPPSTHNDNVNILYAPYNNHSESTQQGKAKTMSVSADALCWWKATQWHFCLCVCAWVNICSSRKVSFSQHGRAGGLLLAHVHLSSLRVSRLLASVLMLSEHRNWLVGLVGV